ncbi:hydrolase, putative [Babesia ovata]|uniref:Hydrolase, putative n=1 Tax=Babesia ovata TaxID=189622 RepID=A0A2H6KIN3_9APIC|nr:hydrolase, putative [Babesia ovata]GBE62848.1 hydrolase, putative [Babesia ovata]
MDPASGRSQKPMGVTQGMPGDAIEHVSHCESQPTEANLCGVGVVGVVEAATVTADGDEEGTAVMCHKAECAGDAEQAMLDHCITLAPEQDVAMRLHALIEHGVRKPCEPRENVPDGAGVPWLRGNTQVTETQVTLEHVVEFVEWLHDIIGELSNLLAAAVTVVPELAVRNARRGDPVAALLEEGAQGGEWIY